MRTRYPAGISRNTVLLAFASLFADISSEMLYPILPIFLTQILHASGSVVGVVEGIAEATQNVVQGFSGWLSDKLQKRKVLALIGYLVSALGKPLMGIATAWPGVLGGRFLERLGAGFRSCPTGRRRHPAWCCWHEPMRGLLERRSRRIERWASR